MVDRDLAARKIASAAARLDDIDEFLKRPREEFLGDVQGRDLTAFYFQLAVQDCLDLASHWVSEAGWPPPDDAGAAFDVLADRNVIPQDLAPTMRAAVGLRNLIAHGYAAVDLDRFYREVHDGKGEIRRFLATMAEAAGLT